MNTLFSLSNLLGAKSIWDAQIWYAIPLVVVISLVYGATRHELLKDVLINCYRSAVWVIGFMAIIFGVIFVAGYFN